MPSLNDMPVWRLVTWNDYRHIFFSHWQVTQAPATPTSTLDEDGEVQSQTTPRASTSLATEEFSARSWRQTFTPLERKRRRRRTPASDPSPHTRQLDKPDFSKKYLLPVFMNKGNRERTKTIQYFWLLEHYHKKHKSSLNRILNQNSCSKCLNCAPPMK